MSSTHRGHDVHHEPEPHTQVCLRARHQFRTSPSWGCDDDGLRRRDLPLMPVGLPGFEPGTFGPAAAARASAGFDMCNCVALTWAFATTFVRRVPRDPTGCSHDS